MLSHQCWCFSTQSYLNPHLPSVQPTLGIKRSALTHFTFPLNSKWIIPLLSNSQMLVDEKFPQISLLRHQSAQLASGKHHGSTSHSSRHDVGALLYICCFYWLMNKTVLASGLAEQSQVGNLNRDRKSRRSQRDTM